MAAGPASTAFSAAAAIWPPTDALLPRDVAAAIAGQAQIADERGELSAATIDALRAAGYFGLPIPVTLHGKGARLLECAAVQHRLGMADPALAIAVNMHLFAVGMATEHWHRRRDSCGLLLEAIASQRRVVAAAFAEPGLGSTLLRSTVKARRTERGYLVSGVKSPCSLAAHCDLVCFQMQAEPPGADRLMTAIVPARMPGVRTVRTWDALGMRASGSDTLVLEDCFVPDELVFHRYRDEPVDEEILAAGLVWFCVITTATYLGVAQGALDVACEGLHSAPANTGVPRAMLPAIQAEMGELAARTLAATSACAAIADRLDDRRHDCRGLVPLALALKHVAVDACVRAVEGSAELVGGRAYARTATLARLWRDVQAARFHSPTRPAIRQYLGRQALGLAASFDFEAGLAE
jgi:alkylation response protein AidB-like acyl-CoA dehydrogenase